MAEAGISVTGINFSGLRKRPKYEELVQYIINDPDKIKYPDRRARLVRNHPYLTQLDGITMQEMAQQQLDTLKEMEKWTTIQRIAMEHDVNPNEMRAMMEVDAPSQRHGDPDNILGGGDSATTVTGLIEHDEVPGQRLMRHQETMTKATSVSHIGTSTGDAFRRLTRERGAQTP